EEDDDEVTFLNTTASSSSSCVNEYVVVSTATSSSSSSSSSSSNHQWELVPEDEPPIVKHTSIRKEIGADSQEMITTKRFEVAREEPLFKMRKDTQLVLVDIPSISDDEAADTKKKQKSMDYVNNHWSTFDSIVLVMDVCKSIKDQTSLLRLVKDNLDSKKQLPVVLLGKTVGGAGGAGAGPPEYNTKDQVELARKEVDKIFGVTADRQRNLDVIFLDDTYDMWQNIDEDAQSTHFGDNHKHRPFLTTTAPLFVPEILFEDWNVDPLVKVLSCLIGSEDSQQRLLEHRIQILLSRLGFEPGFVKQLEMYHKYLVSLSSDIDVRPAFWQLCAALEQSYFDCCPELQKATDIFARIAKECKEYERFATEQGWDTEATRVVASARSSCCRFFASMNWHFGFVFDLTLLYNELKTVSPNNAIDRETQKALNEAFARLITDLWRQTLVVVNVVSDALKFLSALVDELVEYDKFAKKAGLEYVRSYIRDTFRFFLRHHLQTLCQKASDGLLHYSYMDPNVPQNWFSSLTPIDWNRVFRSILLLRYDPLFCQEFGNEIVWMEYVIDQANSAVVPDVTGNARPFKNKPVVHNQRQMFMKPIFGSGGGGSESGGEIGGNQQQQQQQLLPLSNGCNNLSPTVLEIPPSFADPNHFAHIAWRYCEFQKAGLQ
ncbi:MAG: hypothetical protein SGBAC_010455, partial [Bacillariaceae sp.]